MKNKKIRLISLVALVAVVALCVLLFVRGCSDKPVPVSAGSEIATCNGFVYYNDENNDIYRMSIGTEETELFKQDFKVLSANEKEVLAKTDDCVVILDSITAGVLHELDIKTNDAQILDKYVYYIDSETRILMRFNKETGSTQTIPMMETMQIDKFQIYNETDIFFTANTDRIVRYNPETVLMMTYAEEKGVTEFSVDEGYIVYNDKYNDNKLFARSINGAEEVGFEQIASKTFSFMNGRIFYIENTKEKDAYKLKINSEFTH